MSLDRLTTGSVPAVSTGLSEQAGTQDMHEPHDRAVNSTNPGPGLVIALHRPDPEVRVLRVAGDLHDDHAAQLRLVVQEQLLLLPRMLVLDLTRVSNVTGPAVESLVQASEDARKAAVELRLVPPCGPVIDAFSVTQQLFELYASLQEALQIRRT
ncbi:STAS domain-containing protein [Pseudonocardia nigra]|uniref:STAS domain-containing protein n=1 Tax=Pseudonocardia nigra TaxID=1921578 RepID=UPI001C606D9A|nr:STAS domain-containing protein [Pseudonocardia nigra]